MLTVLALVVALAAVIAAVAAVVLSWRLTQQTDYVGSLYGFLREVIDQALGNPERVAMVAMVLAVSQDPSVRRTLTELVAGLCANFVGCQVGIDILGATIATRVVAVVGQDIDPTVAVCDTYCQYTLAAGRVVAIEDALADPKLMANPVAEVVRSYLGSPLTVGGQGVGVCCLFHPEPRVWSEKDKDALSAFTGDVAEVFENAMSARVR